MKMFFYYRFISLKAILSQYFFAPMLFFMTFFTGCRHSASIRTLPPAAEVFAIDENGQRMESLGKTPIQSSSIGVATQALEIELPGYLPSKIILPPGNAKNLEINVLLREFNEKSLGTLSPEVYQRAVDKVTGELITLQQNLFSLTPDEATAEIEKQSKNLDKVASFHYVVGSYYFYTGRFDLAVRAFTRALELNPSHEQAKRMAILTDVKLANQTQASRSKAFAALQAAATEVAMLSNGFLVRTKSREWLTEFDGFEMIIPSDFLFKPATAKFEKNGLAVLSKLAGELKRSEAPRAITVEAHTDSDVSAELSQGGKAILRGKMNFKNVWELSSARAATVVDFLRNEGSIANTWNIAGYGDSRPLKISNENGKPNPKLNTDPQLSRRVVIRVTNLPKEQPLPSISGEEAQKIKERLNNAQQEDTESKPKNNPLAKNRSQNLSKQKGALNSKNSNKDNNANSGKSENNSSLVGGTGTADTSGAESGELNSSNGVGTINAEDANTKAASEKNRNDSDGNSSDNQQKESTRPVTKNAAQMFESFFDSASNQSAGKKPAGKFNPNARPSDVPKPKLPSFKK